MKSEKVKKWFPSIIFRSVHRKVYEKVKKVLKYFNEFNLFQIFIKKCIRDESTFLKNDFSNKISLQRDNYHQWWLKN